MNPEIAEVYGNKVRIRVCGVCWKGESVLMVKHKFGEKDFWAPPGGGIEFGESIQSALKREFLEETGLQVKVQRFLFGCEFVKASLHAIELFFEVEWVSGELMKGDDPELSIIQDVQFLTAEQLRSFPKDELHGMFGNYRNTETLRELSGFYSI
jgi:8-oxo-dGTP diphosphatase